MSAVSTFTNKFNGEFSKAYIENGKTVRPALKYDEVVALQQAYNDYSKEEVRAIFNGSEINAGDIRDMGSIPGSGRSPGGGNGNPIQYFCPRNPMNREAWWAPAHGVAKSWTQLNN